MHVFDDKADMDLEPLTIKFFSSAQEKDTYCHQLAKDADVPGSH